MNKFLKLEECFSDGVLPQADLPLGLMINGERKIINDLRIKGSELLALIGKKSNEFFLAKKTNIGKEIVEPDSIIDFTNERIERFIVQPMENKVLDLEDCFNKGRIPVITYQYVIKINTQKFTVSEEKMTGRQILSLIGGTPEAYFLRQRTKDGKKLIEADEVIDFTECGIERFIAQKRNCNEGFVNDGSFSFPEEDERFLKNLGLETKLVSEGNQRWLIIKDYLLPAGYNRSQADVAILIHPQYPQVQLDMIYIHPALSRVDGKVIGQIASQQIDGRSFQRWSRHRNAENPWVPGDDNIETHLDLMMDCLRAEFKKR